MELRIAAPFAFFVLASVVPIAALVACSPGAAPPIVAPVQSSATSAAAAPSDSAAAPVGSTSIASSVPVTASPASAAASADPSAVPRVTPLPPCTGAAFDLDALPPCGSGRGDPGSLSFDAKIVLDASSARGGDEIGATLVFTNTSSADASKKVRRLSHTDGFVTASPLRHQLDLRKGLRPATRRTRHL